MADFEPDVLKPYHQCKKIAHVTNMGEGRSWWMGKLTEPVADWPSETHCLHLKTPLKDIVLLVNVADMMALATLAQLAHGTPISHEYLTRMGISYEKAAAREES